MDGDAAVDGAEDRVVAVVSHHGEALFAPLAQAIETVFRFAEVPAAVQLRDVSGQSSHVPDVGRRHAGSGLGQGRVFLLDDRVGGDIGQACGRADFEHSTFFLDVIEAGDGFEVDQRRGIGRKDVVLECTEEIGASAIRFDLPSQERS